MRIKTYFFVTVLGIMGMLYGGAALLGWYAILFEMFTPTEAVVIVGTIVGTFGAVAAVYQIWEETKPIRSGGSSSECNPHS